MLKRSLSSLALVVLFAVVHADPPQYTVVILDPGTLPYSQGIGIGGGQQVGQAQWSDANSNFFATLWSGTAASAVNLNPPGIWASVAADTDGTYQVGSTLFPVIGGGEDSDAAMWQGTAASYINMSPPNSSRSYIAAIDHGIEVGSATINDVDYSGYWTGTDPNSFTPLPAPLNTSQAFDISGNEIVGDVDISEPHAYVWNISTHVNKDLNPSGWDASTLIATDGSQYVGIAFMNPDFHAHAGLWDAATGTFTNLHPANWVESFASGVHGGIQVGYVSGVGTTQAALWQGTAASYLDLQQFLPSTFVFSFASNIDTQGNIIGWGMNQIGGVFKNQALMWVPLVHNPPPYTFLGFFSPLNDPASPESTFKIGRALPIKFALQDNGLAVISASATISLDKMNGNTATPIEVSKFANPSNDGANFKLDGEAAQYVYILDTKNLDPGQYRITVTIAQTGQTHTDTFTLTANAPKKGGH